MTVLPDLELIPKPELGRATDSRLTPAYLEAHPELEGFPAFVPGVDVDLTEETNRVIAYLHSLVAYASPELAQAMAEATSAAVEDMLSAAQTTLTFATTGQTLLNTLLTLSGTGVAAGSKAALDGLFASATLNQVGTDLATGNVYQKVSGASSWGSPIATLVTPTTLQNTATVNLLPEGNDVLVHGGGLQPYKGTAYVPPVRGGKGPLGGDIAMNTDGGWSAWTVLPNVLPVPATGETVKVRIYMKPLAGHQNNVRLNPITKNQTELFGTESSGITITTATATVGTTADGFGIYEFTSKTWPADCLGFIIAVNLNFTKLAGQSQLGGVIVTPSSQTVRKDTALPTMPRGPRSGLSEREISQEIDNASFYAIPTEASKLTEYCFDTAQVGIWADVQSFRASSNYNYLLRSMPMIDAIIALRDDRRSSARADFRGIVRPLWGTDQFQPRTDGDLYAVRDINAVPLHPGVYVHFPLHQALLVHPILLWIEAVRGSQAMPATLTTAATTYLTRCLEVIDHLCANNYASSTHETNTDPSPMLAGEGRFFMTYDSSQPVANREGYSYLAGGIEMPINMDSQVSAALYAAYRLTRGTGTAAATAAAGYKDKADSIMRRVKRSLYSMEGFTGWRYTRLGTWQQTPWTTTSPANNPYLKGWSRYTNPATNATAYGEDWDHITISLRGIRECWHTSNIFTQEEVTGMARSILGAYWLHPQSMRSYYMPTPELFWSRTTGISNAPGITSPELAWLTAYDTRLSGLLREWYASGRFNRRYAAGHLRAHGIL